MNLDLLSTSPEDDDGLTYKLRRWPPVSAQFSGPGELRALALLASRPVSLAVLCGYSGLAYPRARSLIAELSLLDLLHMTDELNRPVGASDASGAVRHRMMARMSHWLNGRHTSVGR